MRRVLSLIPGLFLYSLTCSSSSVQAKPDIKYQHVCQNINDSYETCQTYVCELALEIASCPEDGTPEFRYFHMKDGRKDTPKIGLCVHECVYPVE